MKEDRWQNVSDTGKRFMQSLLTVDPSRRLNAAQAMQHPWIAQRTDRNSDNEVAVEESTVKALQAFGKASKFRRVCFFMVAWSLTNAERSKVFEEFLKIDKSKEGTITADELKQVLFEKLGTINDSEVHHIFDTLDTNHDEHIHYTDFLAAMVSTHTELHDGLLRKAFCRFDTDRSGFITASNVRSVLGDRFENVEVEQLMSEADYNQDGVISFPEFCSYLRGEEIAVFSPGSARATGSTSGSSTSTRFEGCWRTCGLVADYLCSAELRIPSVSAAGGPRYF